jgi:hypothetical protein
LRDAAPVVPRAGVGERAKQIAADVGCHWHLAYRTLRGLRPAADDVGRRIIAHPLARAA